MAIKHNYTIVPVASIGISEMLKILYDVPAARAMKFLGEKRVETLPLMIPQRLQRMYVSIGAPISTLHYNGEWEGKDGKENQVELRNRTRGALLELIDETRKVQAKDPKRYHIFSRG
jgi:1-acyl-sn-glycerol-3-phosphate acyltransferase